MYFQNIYSIVKRYKGMLEYRSQHSKSRGGAEDGRVIEAKWTEKLNSGARNDLCVFPFRGQSVRGGVLVSYCSGKQKALIRKACRSISMLSITLPQPILNANSSVNYIFALIFIFNQSPLIATTLPRQRLLLQQ